MWAFLVFGFLWAVGLTFSAAPGAAEPTRLSGEKIKTTFAGAVLELDTPLGTKVPIRFTKDGMMNGDAGALGAYLGADRDRGRWWVSGDHLCMKWFKWFEAAVHCFSLQLHGNRVYWQEQGGRSGTATIAFRPKEEPQPRPVVASVLSAPERVEPAPKRTDATPKHVGAPHKEPRSVQVAAPATSVERAPVHAPQPAASAEKHVSPAAEARQPAPAMRIAKAADGEPVAQTGTQTIRQSAKSAAIPPLPVRAAAALAVPQPVPVRRAFRVIRVATNDVLNVRSGPSEYHTAVGAIEPDGRGIDIIGPCRGHWCPIRYGRMSGWVNSYYLAPEWAASPLLIGAR